MPQKRPQATKKPSTSSHTTSLIRQDSTNTHSKGHGYLGTSPKPTTSQSHQQPQTSSDLSNPGQPIQKPLPTLQQPIQNQKPKHKQTTTFNHPLPDIYRPKSPVEVLTNGQNRDAVSMFNPDRWSFKMIQEALEMGYTVFALHQLQPTPKKWDLARLREFSSSQEVNNLDP